MLDNNPHSSRPSAPRRAWAWVGLTLLCAMAATAAPTDPAPVAKPRLGTLIYSPAERSAIVRERSGDAPDAASSSHLRLSGIVKRERGNSTAWINRQAVAEGQSLPPTSRTRISATAVTLDGQRLRVGEALDINTRERSDIVSPGAVTTRGKN